MPREFKLPDLGEGVAEGEIVKWLVSEGSEIKEDQPLVEIMTDKATVQIPSPATGKVGRILAKEGQTVKVGSVIVTFDSGAEEPKPELTPSPPEAQTESTQKQTGPTSPVRIVATPATRKLARELQVEIETITGTGPAGRITDQDVRNATEKDGRAGPYNAVSEKTEAVPPSMSREERIAIHGIRKRISEKMSKSSRETAAVTHVDEIDLTELIALREKLKPLAGEQGVRLTFLPFIMKAALSALKEFPHFNAAIDDEKQQIVLKRYYNLGFATDTNNGLMVPVVKDVDKKNIVQIAREIEDLSTKAREGKISLGDIQGGTFTITNIGTLGGILSTPIINVPEVAILGVHKIQKRPVVKDNQIVIRDMTFLALTFDHRIVDGADGARFTSKIIRILENPGLFMLDEIRFS
ncbi:MAG: dihydrolipoamide acetyltransferase family protein [Nitrososphaerales archaeon]